MDVRPSIVGIVAKAGSGNKFSGTGFFVEGRLILTCAHVVDAAQVTGEKVQFRIEGQNQFHDAEIVYKGSATGLDMCVLKPTNLTVQTPCLRLITSKQSEGNKFQAFGYPLEGEQNGLHGTGIILGGVKDNLNREALQCSSKEVTHGYSGSPVWVEEAGGVVGMISGGFDFGLNKKLGETVYAIPSETLRNAFPRLEIVEFKNNEKEIRIRALLFAQNFEKALEECEKTLEQNPDAPIINLLTAISILKMKGADSFKSSIIKRVEKHLENATKGQELRSTALVIWGLVKYDHYVLNGLYQGTPSVQQIKKNLQSVSAATLDLSFIKMIKASRSAFGFFELSSLLAD